MPLQTLADFKKVYGDEYPHVVVIKGIRLPLSSERRFSRSYHSNANKMGSEISRFMDGSASITFSELQRDWAEWTSDMRLDFCQSCHWLGGQADFPEMLRFIMRHGGPVHWSGVALGVVSQFSREEAFHILKGALAKTELASSGNIAQAIARTKHPDAETTLREHLALLWRQPTLWDNADFINWIGFAATTCVAHLTELGISPADFESQARQLSKHVCSGNRRSCRNFLSKYYPWLKELTPDE